MSDLNSQNSDSNQSVSSAWSVDRIEGDYAVLSARDHDDEISLPLVCCPQGLREGDSVTLHLSAQPQVSAAARDEVAAQIASLAEEDDGDDFSL